MAACARQGVRMKWKRCRGGQAGTASAMIEWEERGEEQESAAETGKTAEERVRAYALDKASTKRKTSCDYFTDWRPTGGEKGRN
eukprot:4612299-Pleurochrysis_carterae.AAC.2